MYRLSAHLLVQGIVLAGNALVPAEEHGNTRRAMAAEVEEVHK